MNHYRLILAGPYKFELYVVTWSFCICEAVRRVGLVGGVLDSGSGGSRFESGRHHIFGT